MQQTKPLRRAWKKRALSLAMALVLMLGLLPAFPAAEASAHWADPYLSQLVEWGFIRADQANNPDRALTRADFMAIVNRAYGYHETGETPFEDVFEPDWYYDDVGIAYTARYIKGTSPTTASPKEPLTRETATTILGRNMMLEESPGELVDFTDAHQISTWASGTIKSSLEHYLVSGYNDGTFRPQRNVSWGEMASMLSSLVGTPLQEPGDYSLGGVYGNVTITSSNVTLRDTVISGDLYISGGVGLGGIVLENVTVLGRIVACGTGQSEGGQASILLRNVTADEMLVDNLQDHYVSIRADGVTEIGKTTVRTSAYIEDNTPDGLGLHYISLEGESYPEGEEPEGWVPIQLDLAGRIEEVVNRTPRSQVRVGAGTVAILTVDETAEGSNVIIDRGAVVRELNLDTGVTVTGGGDIEHLVVNAPGCEVEMLPDEIDIRPGITAIIDGEEMDTVGAKESSEQPRILAGYPEAQDVVPTGLDAAFMTNKAGTVYWAVSAINDGSVGEEDLIKPPSYGSIAVAKGSVRVLKGNEETLSKVTGLTPGGSYYLSAVLVDARGQRSPVKVISFTTPDNTIPEFCAGYPRMSRVGTGRRIDENGSFINSVVTIMPTKDCKLYYALLPEGAKAPTEDELKSNAVSGALGYGVRDVKKNVEDSFVVHDRLLEEQTTYVLYLWLVDADGINKGKIVSLKFTTADETPPYFIVDPTPNKVQATSVSLTFRLNEDGVVFWVAVPTGTVYPKPDPETGDNSPRSEYGKLQIVNGMNIGANGKSGRVNAKMNADGTITVSGLLPETSYDFYYVAQDTAGNYSEVWKMITINTLDTNGPKVTQSFSRTAGTDKDKDPLSSTDIYLDFSENVRYTGPDGGKSFLDLYQAVVDSNHSKASVELLAKNLFGAIKLYKVSIQGSSEELVRYNIDPDYNFAADDTMTIDYTQARVEILKEGGIRVTFPNSALHLENGGEYYFTIGDITDTSNNQNEITPDPVDFKNNRKESEDNGHHVPPFVVDLPVVDLDTPLIGSEGPIAGDGSPVRIDMSFYMDPKSTRTMSDSIAYDVVLWSRSIMSYDLYYRIVDHSGKVLDYAKNTDIMLANTSTKTPDENGWIFLKNSERCVPVENGEDAPDKPRGWEGRSLSAFFNDCNSSQYARLNQLSEDHYYQFVISLTEFNTWGTDYRNWNATAFMEINVAAGQPQKLDELAGRTGEPSRKDWIEEVGEDSKGGDIIRGFRSIGNWRDGSGQTNPTQTLKRTFHVSTVPSFDNNTPEFEFPQTGDVNITLNLTSNGIVHYAISEVSASTKRPALTTIREMIPNTDDYTVGDDGQHTTTPADNVQTVGNGKEPPQMYITTDGPRPPVLNGNTNEYPMPDWMIGGGPGSAVDDPEGENKIIEPSNLLIVQNKWQSQVVDSGTFTPVEGINDPLTIDSGKVKPNTTYFIYFVITSVDDYSNMSHVYIYQFTTPAARKPAVRHESDDGGNVDLLVDVASRSGYRIITKVDALDPDVVSFLNQPFAKYTDHTGNVKVTQEVGDDGRPVDVYEYDEEADANTEVTDKTPKVFLVKPDGSPYTVLDALIDDYNYMNASVSPASSGLIKDDPSAREYYYPDRDGDATVYGEGYTVFDMYASNAARDHIYNFILNGKFLAGETANISGNTPYETRFDTDAPEKEGDYADTFLKTGEKLNDSTYIIFTYSINPRMVQDSYPATSSQNTSYIATFRASEVTKGEMKPPEVDEETSGSIRREGAGDTFAGTFYIHFDPRIPAFLMGTRPVKMSDTNLLTGVRDDLKPSKSFGNGTVTVENVYGDTAFEVSFSGVKVGDRFIFPSGYFTNANGDVALKTLTIEVTSEGGTIYLVITWPGGNGSPWKFPLKEDTGSYMLFLTGDDLGAGEAVQGPRTATMSVDGTIQVTAAMNPSGLLNESSSWEVTSGSGVIELSPGGTGPDSAEANPATPVTITALSPGKATITVTGSGVVGGVPQTANNTIEVTVTGPVDAFTSSNVTLNGAAQFVGDTLTLPLDGTSYAEFTVTSGSKGLSSSAQVRCPDTSSGKLSLDISGNKITIKQGTKPTVDDVFTLEVSLQAADGTDLTTENGKKTITVKFKEVDTVAAKTTETAVAKVVTPTSLTLSNVSGAKLSGSAMKMTGTSLTSTIKATINPSGATGTITWTSSNPKIATVAPSGTGNSQVKITGLTAGTATITATVGKVTRSFTVTVSPSISISSFAANSTASTVKQETDGTYTWTRKSGTSCAATMKFTTGLSLDNTTVTVTSSDTKAVSVGKVTKSGATGQVQLTFGAMNKTGQVTITVKAGTVSQSFKIKLVGSDVSAVNITAAKK